MRPLFRKARSFARVSRRRKALFVAVVMLSALRFVLRALRLRIAVAETWYRDKRPPGPLTPHHAQRARDVAWAVQAGTRYIPWRNLCRHQAWQAAVLLTYFGVPYTYFVGVRRGPDRALQGHAWVKVNHRFVCGHCDERTYSLVDVLGPASQPLVS